MFVHVLVRFTSFAIAIDPFCSCGFHRQFLVDGFPRGNHFVDFASGHFELLKLMLHGEIDSEGAEALYKLMYEPGIFDPIDAGEIEIASLLAFARGKLFAPQHVLAEVRITSYEGYVLMALADGGAQRGLPADF